ncbi:MAG: cell division protein FtsZ [Candidatus Brennerbacteria bacterium CG11_big_fil_rev_8_21_14_0_20_43_10]|uniref:Cell division protein FtsZ n=3 Tax=Candidatus Brenneribacteriota TaxID=1817902 RepID=A0A2M8C150_9BACT|nr:MAG: cell division protein FtsZ [Candidatus Brennerbacteria bacterium CG23_combo_of_CG06-09_8_20_14_all_44_41]PIR26480.1 MAG: cell division protein FtsZ [Candidatus Brennerbacteria bacterium CG11_big_fil_rev_8_21_14_0_20_43_10]PIX28978.1 MAG: cell division protein FtsZ [Candidatus Brennerbacteria bacterium CG_4_8_14_3_um_filter_43_14]PJA19348.1 MAG: cell division protein FtsZ [Candidatus Brennerbacteria bacterium CG_4_10_14_0_2_um_filter_43_14]PJB49784.1 MAG: cell division protein FtsZ [Cand
MKKKNKMKSSVRGIPRQKTIHLRVNQQSPRAWTKSLQRETQNKASKKREKHAAKQIHELLVSRQQEQLNVFLPKIRIVGIGGAGGNALTRMEGIMKGIETIAFNTDAQDLKMCRASKKVQIGKHLTHGRGAGMNPEIGRQAAEENKEEIAKTLEGSELVFLTCGLGGGTGSGAAPVVAQIARSQGSLCVAIVTMPFSFEGTQRYAIASRAWAMLRDCVDALITVSNDRVFNVISQDTSLKKAFWHIDEILREGVQAVYDIIMKPGLINVDFSDVKTIMQNSGPALLGIGMAKGKDRAHDAANRAIGSPLLDMTMENAHHVLLNISSREGLTMLEVQQAAQTITASIAQDARVIFGATFDHRLGKGDMKITVIATGFGEDSGSVASRALPLGYEQKHIAEISTEESQSHKDMLSEKMKQFEGLEEPAFLRRKKPSEAQRAD